MSKQSYIRGFCKAAEAHGVDPEILMKMAALPGASRLGEAVLKKIILPSAQSAKKLISQYAALSKRPRFLPTRKGRDKALGETIDFIDWVKATTKGPTADILSKRHDTQLLRQINGNHSVLTPEFEAEIAKRTMGEPRPKGFLDLSTLLHKQ